MDWSTIMPFAQGIGLPIFVAFLGWNITLHTARIKHLERKTDQMRHWQEIQEKRQLLLYTPAQLKRLRNAGLINATD